MSFSAKVVADSKNEFGNRITTMVVTFPRFILAEFNTHRMFSRNSASSRAIPFEKMVETVDKNPFIPIAWQIDHKGMQGTEYLTAPIDLAYTHDTWLDASKQAIKCARFINHNCRVTKQLANRLLEPFMWHTVIVTATEWENFFELRCPKYEVADGANKKYFRSRRDLIAWIKDFPRIQEAIQQRTEAQWFESSISGAEIHMQRIAELMWDAYNESTPTQLQAGEWHIPFGDSISAKVEDWTFLRLSNELQGKELLKYFIKIATARCAQVSYTIVGEDDKPMDYKKLVALHDRLAKAGHWSPFEHCAKSMNTNEYYILPYQSDYNMMTKADQKRTDAASGWSGNLRGFVQYRKMFDNENITVKL